MCTTILGHQDVVLFSPSRKSSYHDSTASKPLPDILSQLNKTDNDSTATLKSTVPQNEGGDDATFVANRLKDYDAAVALNVDDFIKGVAEFVGEDSAQISQRIRDCQQKLQQIDRRFLECLLNDDFSGYSIAETKTQLKQALALSQPLLELEQTLDELTPKSRMLFGLKLTHILSAATMIVTGTLIIVLPMVWPVVFSVGSTALSLLYVLERDGNRAVSGAGVALSLYQWVLNKKDTTAQEKLTSCKNSFARIRACLNEKKIKEMDMKLDSISNQLVHTETQLLQLDQRVASVNQRVANSHAEVNKKIEQVANYSGGCE